MKQIKDLHSQQPIEIHNNKPASEDDLKELLQRLASYQSDSTAITKPELKIMFQQLYDHYSAAVDEGEWEDIPVTIGEINLIYQHLAWFDQTDNTDFDGVNPKEKATLMDFTILLDKMTEYYGTGNSPINDME